MALFNCPNCGKEISDRGTICPYCKNWIDTAAYRQMAAQKKQELDKLAEQAEREYRQSYEYKRKNCGKRSLQSSRPVRSAAQKST